jgi:hypothetical protein
MSKRSRAHRRKQRRRTRRVLRGGTNSVKPDLVYNHPGAEVKVFTSADRMEPTLAALLASLKKHHYSYEVVGFGKPWKGFQTKIENYLSGIKSYIAAAGPDAIAIFVDAFDVLCIKDAEKVLATYRSRPRTMPIVLSGEICCFDNCYKDVLNWYDKHGVLGGRSAIESSLEKHKFGVLSDKPVFMNTGFIMGPAKALEEFYTAWMNTPFEVDDQYTAGKWVVNNLDKIDINAEETLIRTKVKPREKLPDENGESGPGFVHFPGTRSKEQQTNNVQKFYSQYL